MPIFEYQCRKCGHVTDFLEKAGSRAAHVCENCGSKKTEKIFSTFSAQVKASSAREPCRLNGTCQMSQDPDMCRSCCGLKQD